MRDFWRAVYYIIQMVVAMAISQSPTADSDIRKLAALAFALAVILLVELVWSIKDKGGVEK